jgi:hypothetical protein
VVGDLKRAFNNGFASRVRQGCASALGIVPLILTGCACITPVPDTRTREEYLIGVSRCIAGSMPIEFRFNIDGNPPMIRNDVLLMSDIDLIVDRLDMVIESVFRGAMTSVLKSTNAGASKIDFESLSWDDFVSDLTVQAGKQAEHWLILSYCGEFSTVTEGYWSIVSGYFDRALRAKGDSGPAWIKEAGGKAVDVLIVGVALRIAGVEFDPVDIIRAANKYAPRLYGFGASVAERESSPLSAVRYSCIRVNVRCSCADVRCDTCADWRIEPSTAPRTTAVENWNFL